MSAIPEDCHLCTEISKRRTIMQATVNILGEKPSEVLTLLNFACLKENDVL